MKLTKQIILNALNERNQKMNYGFSKNHISNKIKEYKNDYYSNDKRYNNFAKWILEDQDYEDRIDQVLDFCR